MSALPVDEAMIPVVVSRLVEQARSGGSEARVESLRVLRNMTCVADDDIRALIFRIDGVREVIVAAAAVAATATHTEIASTANPAAADEVDLTVVLRLHAVASLRNLSCCPPITPHMWADAAGCRAVLLRLAQPGGSEEDDPLRLESVTALRNLASAPENARSMWEDEGCRAVCLAGAAEEGSSRSPETAALRLEAVKALRNLSAAPANEAAMFADKELRRVFTIGASPTGQPDDVREACLRGLQHLASANQAEMYNDAGVRVVLLEGAAVMLEETEETGEETEEKGAETDGGEEEEGEREKAVCMQWLCVSILRVLSTRDENAVRMWADVEGCRAVFLDCAAVGQNEEVTW